MGQRLAEVGLRFMGRFYPKEINTTNVVSNFAQVFRIVKDFVGNFGILPQLSDRAS